MISGEVLKYLNGFLIGERYEANYSDSSHFPLTMPSGWLGRQGSNLRMPIPKTGALPLGHAPPENGGTIRETVRRCNALKRAIFQPEIGLFRRGLQGR